MIQDVHFKYSPDYRPQAPKPDDTVYVLYQNQMKKSTIQAYPQAKYGFHIGNQPVYYQHEKVEGMHPIRQHDNHDETFIAATLMHLARWDSQHEYCGHCGHPLVMDGQERAKVCDACQSRYYPQLMPAVIVAVRYEDQLLTCRYANRLPGHDVLIAGFCEIGESMEDTVRREVFEEVGLRVHSIQYVASQPWGYASNLLAGFVCWTDDPTVCVDGQELASATWKTAQELGVKDTNSSLTNKLMADFCAGQI